MAIIFLHGLESKPEGSKYQALSRHFYDVYSPNCIGIYDIKERIYQVEDFLFEKKLENESLFLVGSSFGALVSLHLLYRKIFKISGILMCAPALHLNESYSFFESLHFEDIVETSFHIVHGYHDAVVDFQLSVNFGKNTTVRFF